MEDGFINTVPGTWIPSSGKDGLRWALRVLANKRVITRL